MRSASLLLLVLRHLTFGLRQDFTERERLVQVKRVTDDEWHELDQQKGLSPAAAELQFNEQLRHAFAQQLNVISEKDKEALPAKPVSKEALVGEEEEDETAEEVIRPESLLQGFGDSFRNISFRAKSKKETTKSTDDSKFDTGSLDWDKILNALKPKTKLHFCMQLNIDLSAMPPHIPLLNLNLGLSGSFMFDTTTRCWSGELDIHFGVSWGYKFLGANMAVSANLQGGLAFEEKTAQTALDNEAPEGMQMLFAPDGADLNKCHSGSPFPALMTWYESHIQHIVKSKSIEEQVIAEKEKHEAETAKFIEIYEKRLLSKEPDPLSKQPSLFKMLLEDESYGFFEGPEEEKPEKKQFLENELAREEKQKEMGCTVAPLLTETAVVMRTAFQNIVKGVRKIANKVMSRTVDNRWIFGGDSEVWKTLSLKRFTVSTGRFMARWPSMVRLEGISGDNVDKDSKRFGVHLGKNQDDRVINFAKAMQQSKHRDYTYFWKEIAISASNLMVRTIDSIKALVWLVLANDPKFDGSCVSLPLSFKGGKFRKVGKHYPWPSGTATPLKRSWFLRSLDTEKVKMYPHIWCRLLGSRKSRRVQAVEEVSKEGLKKWNEQLDNADVAFSSFAKNMVAVMKAAKAFKQLKKTETDDDDEPDPEEAEAVETNDKDDENDDSMEDTFMTDEDARRVRKEQGLANEKVLLRASIENLFEDSLQVGEGSTALMVEEVKADEDDDDDFDIDDTDDEDFEEAYNWNRALEPGGKKETHGETDKTEKGSVNETTRVKRKSKGDYVASVVQACTVVDATFNVLKEDFTIHWSESESRFRVKDKGNDVGFLWGDGEGWYGNVPRDGVPGWSEEVPKNPAKMKAIMKKADEFNYYAVSQAVTKRPECEEVVLSLKFQQLLPTFSAWVKSVVAQLELRLLQINVCAGESLKPEVILKKIRKYLPHKNPAELTVDELGKNCGDTKFQMQRRATFQHVKGLGRDMVFFVRRQLMSLGASDPTKHYWYDKGVLPHDQDPAKIRKDEADLNMKEGQTVVDMIAMDLDSGFGVAQEDTFHKEGHEKLLLEGVRVKINSKYSGGKWRGTVSSVNIGGGGYVEVVKDDDFETHVVPTNDITSVGARVVFVGKFWKNWNKAVKTIKRDLEGGKAFEFRKSPIRPPVIFTNTLAATAGFGTNDFCMPDAGWPTITGSYQVTWRSWTPYKGSDKLWCLFAQGRPGPFYISAQRCSPKVTSPGKWRITYGASIKTITLAGAKRKLLSGEVSSLMTESVKSWLGGKAKKSLMQYYEKVQQHAGTKAFLAMTTAPTPKDMAWFDVKGNAMEVLTVNDKGTVFENGFAKVKQFLDSCDVKNINAKDQFSAEVQIMVVGTTTFTEEEVNPLRGPQPVLTAIQQGIKQFKYLKDDSLNIVVRSRVGSPKFMMGGLPCTNWANIVVQLDIAWDVTPWLEALMETIDMKEGRSQVCKCGLAINHHVDERKERVNDCKVCLKKGGAFCDWKPAFMNLWNRDYDTCMSDTAEAKESCEGETNMYDKNGVELRGKFYHGKDATACEKLVPVKKQDDKDKGTKQGKR